MRGPAMGGEGDGRIRGQAAAEGEGSLADSWPAGNAAVGLTEQRLLVFDYTADFVESFDLVKSGA